jgi:TolB-like protein
MLAGRPPFQGGTPQALVARHRAEAVPDLRSTDPGIPLFVQRAVERAMAKVPDDRFPSAAAFAEALTSGTVVARVRRRQLAQWTQAAIAVALAVTAGWWLARAAPTPRVRSLAVLPLTNLSGDSAQGYFVNGVHEQLISELAQTGVTVIARSSVMQFRNSDKTVAEIARALNVDAVVEGGVFRAGDSVEIETRLIEAGSNVPMWRGRYGATLANVVALYRGITRALADRIEIALSQDAEARLSRRDSVNPEVYEAYLRGMHYLDGPGPRDNEIGLRYLQQAVDQNPVDARAWAGLAYGYITIGHSFAPTAEARNRAAEAARRAVRLDPQLADGWAALAAVKTYYEYDWAGAEEAFQRASALNPSLPNNRYHYAWFLDLFRRWDQAIVEHQRAEALDPFMPAPSAWLGALYADAGRTAEGIRAGEDAVARFPDALVARVALGWTYITAARWDDAIATFQQASAAAPQLHGFLAWAYAGAGRAQEARAIADRLEARPNAMNALTLAATYSHLGEWDRAISWLEYQPSHAWLPWWLTQKAPPEVRRRPEYRAVVHQMRLDSLVAEG